MKTTQDIIFEFVQKACLSQKNNNGMATKQIADALQLQRTNVSACLNRLVAMGKLVKTTTRPVKYRIVDENLESKQDAFAGLIGADSVHMQAIQLAKAAILYPLRPLNVILCANGRGNGTSRFAKAMFTFAQEHSVLSETAHFVKANCESYSDIEQLEKDLFCENGFFQQANHGMLLLDHLSELNAVTINTLISYIDNGYIEIHGEEIANVILVFVSDGYVDTRIEKTLFRKISMMIHLESFGNYKIRDRFDMICNFFARESQDVQKQISVSSEVIRNLLERKYQDNLKQLRAMIKRACASSYVKSYTNNQDMKVLVSDFAGQLQQINQSYHAFQYEIDALIGKRDFIVFQPNQGFTGHKDNQIYTDLREKYTELDSQGLDKNNIEIILSNYIQKLMDYSAVDEKIEKISIETLSKIVDIEVIDTVKDFLDDCSKQFRKSYSKNQFYGLCLHIHSLLHKKKDRQHIGNEQINRLITDYPKEYAASFAFAENILKQKFDMVLSVDEIMLITLFLVDTKEKEQTPHPVLLFIMHGDSTASSICKVVNSLTLSANAYAYDMSLEKDPMDAQEEIEELCCRINRGAGIIIIYDMGSIKTIVETIASRVEFSIRMIYYPITLVGIEIARKCSVNTDIDYVYHAALRQMVGMRETLEKKVSMVITLCESGQGGASTMKEYIEKNSHLGYQVEALAVSDQYELKTKVEQLLQQYTILAFVGTYDPHLAGIPFIGIHDMIEAGPENIDAVLQFQAISESSLSYDLLYESLATSLNHVPMIKIRKVLPPLINTMSNHFDLNHDQKYGLFIHIACMIDRIIGKEMIKETKHKEDLFDKNPEAHKYVMHCIHAIEKSFGIIVNDDEVAVVLMMCCKL